MGASRTLLRRQTKERVTLPNGQVVIADRPARPPRTKPGTLGHRLRSIWARGGYELELHVTKGPRLRRVYG